LVGTGDPEGTPAPVKLWLFSSQHDLRPSGGLAYVTLNGEVKAIVLFNSGPNEIEFELLGGCGELGKSLVKAQ
jgi:hypothetical protein